VVGAPVGSLFFAGEHCALETQGFMEGGVESGQIAADAVLAMRGLRAAAGVPRSQARRIAASA